MAVEAFVITRILLNIFNANFSNAFASWIRSISDIFISPFSGITANGIQIDNTVISLTPFVALLFYIIAAFILSELLKAFSKE